MNTSRIAIRLAGGLGNQLFQFAAAVSLAKKKNIPLSNISFDLRYLNKYESIRSCEIVFVAKLFEGVDVDNTVSGFSALVSQFRLAKILDKRIGGFDLISSDQHLNNVFESSLLSRFMVLDGYFQNSKFIFDQSDCRKIYSSLVFNKKEIINRVKNGLPTIGVHIRRGDYVSSKSAVKVFRNIPLEFYDAALKKLRTDQKILIFSDDSEVSAFYAKKIDAIDVCQLGLSLEDEFCLLMACDDHIIANSTFSFWAAFLGRKPNGRLIAPRFWYKNSMRNQSNSLLLPYCEFVDEY